MLLNFPHKSNRKIWQRHFGAHGLNGEFHFLYHGQFPRIAYVSDGNENECIKYFSDKTLFSTPPTWLILSHESTKKILRYDNGRYHPYSASLDWDKIKHSDPVEITEKCARVIIDQIFKIHKAWLANPLSRAAIGSIPRIFSECTALIYELIQNAFDADATSVKIELEKNNLKFLHNGYSFSESDANAISFVNLSNKDKDKTGFMGIGFKSAFEASIKPEVHSDPFSFLFDNSTEGGFILPQNTSPKIVPRPFTTLIYIPFKKERIHDLINAELMPEEKKKRELGFSRKTFLHLLKEKNNLLKGITKVETPYVKFKIERGHLPNSYQIFDLENGAKTNQRVWLYFEKKFRPSPAQTADFLRSRGIKNEELEKEGWEETVSIIIPLTRTNSGYSPIKDYAGILNVYLPTKIKTGFNFDLQGNFIISAGREKLRNIGGEWNGELFTHIGEPIVRIFEWCKSLKSSSEVNLSNFYSLIPDWDEIEFLPEDIIENVRSRFIRLFNSEELIPIETSDSRGIRYKYPRECIIVDDVVLNLFGKRTIEKLSERKVVLRSLDKEARQKIVNSSSVGKWGAEETIRLLSKKDWVQCLPKFKSRRQCNKWVSELYAYLNHYLPSVFYDVESKERRDEILNCRIFPTEWSDTGKRYKFDRYRFAKEKLYRLPREQAKLPLEAFRHKISIIDQGFEDYIRGRPGKMTEEERTTIEGSRALLERLGIPTLEPNTMVRDFIVPLFRITPDHQKNVLVDYTSFICEHRKEIDTGKVNILLLNRKGEFCEPGELFLGEQYGFSDLHKFFGDARDEIFLSDKYLAKKTISTDEWVNFFLSIGVNEYLPLEIVKETLSKHKLKEKLGEDFKGFENIELRVSWINDNFPGERFLLLDADFTEQVKDRLVEVQSLPLVRKKDCMRAFLRVFDKHWERRYSKNVRVKIEYYTYGQMSYGEPNERTLYNRNTRFAEYFLKEKWVPAMNSNDLRNPSQVVALTEENISLSDEGIILCEEEIRNLDLLNFLKFKPLPENITNLDRLVNLKNNGSENLDRYRELYRLINKDIEEKKIAIASVRKEFSESKLIYANHAFWEPEEILFNPPSTLRIYYPAINETYPDMQDFFCKTLGCDNDNPSIGKILMCFLKFMWVTDRGMDDTLRASVLYCYRKLLDFVNEQENQDYKNNPLWKRFVSDCKVFCRNSGWTSTQGGKAVVSLDVFKHEDNFLRCKKINIESHLRQLNRDTNDLLPLLELLNVRAASRCIKEQIRTRQENIHPSTAEIEKNIDLLLESVISVLGEKYRDSGKKERTQLNKFNEKLRELKQYRKVVYKTSSIVSTVYLNGDELFRVNKTCHIDKDIGCLKIHVSDDVRIIYGQLSSELCHVLETSILPGNIEKLVRSLIDRTVGNIEGNFERSIKNFYMEIGAAPSEVTPEVMTADEEKGDEEGREEPVETEEPASEDITETTAKKPYEDVVEPVDYSGITLTSIISDGITPPAKDDQTDSRARGLSGRTRRHFTPNPYDKEDGERGEEIVFEKEKERLAKIGLGNHVSKIKHISKSKPQHPWDIESFDKDEKTGEAISIRIEVKATPDPQNLVFPMSEQQFKAALDTKNPKGVYFIYRVFSVRSAKPEILRYNFYDMFSKRLINFKNKDFYVELPSTMVKKDDPPEGS